MLAIIPARGGSKGLPGKNIMSLSGKPLIAHTIEAAIESEYVSRVIVSTDDKDIADVAVLSGAEVPFLRPEELSGDKSKAIDAYIYTIDELKRTENIEYGEFVVLQPTSPLRTSEDIDLAIKLFSGKNADSVISCCLTRHPPQWAKTVDKSLKITSLFDIDKASRNRQELEQTYIPNGAVYVFKTASLKKNLTYYTEKTFAYIMPDYRSVDIDTLMDFKFAEFIMKEKDEGFFDI